MSTKKVVEAPVIETRVLLKNRFASQKEMLVFMDRLRKSGNATQTAHEYGLKPITVVHFARRSNIKLRAPGRPHIHNFDENKILAKLKKVIGERGGVANLSKETKLPYGCLYRVAVKHGLVK